jgi:hypothetical protein
MTESREPRNKAKAFDTLFSTRDYAATVRFWSSDHVQRSAHIEPGREGVFRLIKGLPRLSNVSRA